MEKKSSKTIAVAPKISDGAAKWYSEIWPSLNAGVTTAIEILPILYRSALAEMKGKFSRGELGMILDVLNGYAGITTMGGWGFVGRGILLEIQDSFRLYPGSYESKWEISDGNDFMRRLSELPRFHLAVLEIWAGAFWEKHYIDTDLDEYIKPLVSQ